MKIDEKVTRKQQVNFPQKLCKPLILFAFSFICFHFTLLHGLWRCIGVGSPNGPKGKAGGKSGNVWM